MNLDFPGLSKSDQQNITTIRASNNSIKSIGDFTIHLLQNVMHIDLRFNKIKSITVNAFANLTKLKHLYLKGNLLTHLVVGTFDKNTELFDLWLQDNRLVILENGIFQHNNGMKDLYLDNNQILAIGPKIFNKSELNHVTMSGICDSLHFKEKETKNFPTKNCIENYPVIKKLLTNLLIKERNLIEHETGHPDIEARQIKMKQIFVFIAITLAILCLSLILLSIAQCFRIKRASKNRNSENVYEKLNLKNLRTRNRTNDNFPERYTIMEPPPVEYTQMSSPSFNDFGRI